MLGERSSSGILLAGSVIMLLAVSAWTWAVEPYTESPEAGLPDNGMSLTRQHWPSVAERFYQFGYELARAESSTASQRHLALLLLMAARRLHADNRFATDVLMELACDNQDQDYTQEVSQWLADYLSAEADIGLVRKAVYYLWERSTSNQQRKALLERLTHILAGRNPRLDSELAMLQGQMEMEQGNHLAALTFFRKAYDDNKYNKMAFARIAELVPDRITSEMYLEHLRYALRANPLDMESALAFSQYVERLELYNIAAGGYQYCVDLFQYLYPGEPLPPEIYLPWAMSHYNMSQGDKQVEEIAAVVRKSGRFDIFVESLAGRSAAKAGRQEEAERVFMDIEQKIQAWEQQGSTTAGTDREDSVQLGPIPIAWFYCFVYPENTKALDWANKAYAQDSNSIAAASMLAYALAVNGQSDLAKPLINTCAESQMAELALAYIMKNEGQRQAAIQISQRAIRRDPASLAAERGKELLTELDIAYQPNPNRDLILSRLAGAFGEYIVPAFVPPDNIVSLRVGTRQRSLSYGESLAGSVSIINNAPEPIIIGEGGIVWGRIRIDAKIEGDITRDYPHLYSSAAFPAQEIQSKQWAHTSIDLITGPLRQALLTYPQAALQIEFTLYLDPVQADAGSVSNRLVDIKPVTITIERPGVTITRVSLQQQYNAIALSGMDRKIEIAQLFVGLLKEQYAMAEHGGALYKFRYADWLPGRLRSALIDESGLLLSPTAAHWPVRFHTMADMIGLPFDTGMRSAVAQNLTHSQWPVRMMALYVLAQVKDRGFDKVLQWTVQHDPEPLVCELASVLLETGS